MDLEIQRKETSSVLRILLDYGAGGMELEQNGHTGKCETLDKHMFCKCVVIGSTV